MRAAFLPLIALAAGYVAGAPAEPPWRVRDFGRLPAGVNTNHAGARGGLDPEHVSDHYPVWLDLER